MKILIADDHPLIIEGFATMLSEALPEAQIRKATDKTGLYEKLEEQAADLLFQDIRFGKDDAREFMGELLSRFPEMKIIVITSLSDTGSVGTLFKQGISGYLLKSDERADVLQAIEAVLKDETYISSGLRDLLQGRRLPTQQQIPLTPREAEVLKLILQEKTTKEISELIFLSEKTVEHHRSNLFLKFNARNMAGLVKRAILEGYL